MNQAVRRSRSTLKVASAACESLAFGRTVGSSGEALGFFAAQQAGARFGLFGLASGVAEVSGSGDVTAAQASAGCAARAADAQPPSRQVSAQVSGDTQRLAAISPEISIDQREARIMEKTLPRSRKRRQLVFALENLQNDALWLWRLHPAKDGRIDNAGDERFEEAG